MSTRTRPDVAFAVSNVARYYSKPTTCKEHWISETYHAISCQFGLHYMKGESSAVIGYSDADWGGDCNDFKSTSGYLFQIGGSAVSWRSKKQSCVALSTAEAEYMALSSTAQEALWLRELNKDLKNPPSGPTIIFEDNQSAICMLKNPQFHGRSKHINIKFHFIREQVTANNMCSF